ncbi:MAG: riboflavin biosynthesis protein RibF [Eubacteriales bacterium]|nr:riboflavin biosynthesis protein RibF [Eubacteriales bacterium]
MQLILDGDLKFKKTCVTFGYFNSMHRGHRSVINRLIEQESKGFSSVLIYLEKDQRVDSDQKCDIYTRDEKFKFLQKNGPMIMVSYPFAEVIESMDPEKFIKEILVGRFDAKVIVAGNNCQFGKSGSGNIHTLKELSEKYGYELVSCETVNYEEKPITDDWINHEIIEGDIETANTLLGSPLTLWGSIIHGKALGRRFGMPTANLRLPANKIIPKHGVYATLTNIDGKWIKGLTNIGRRPSVDDQTHVSVETYLLDFSDDLYGKEVGLELHHYIRGVKKFNNLEEVTQQVKLDIIAAKDILLI